MLKESIGHFLLSYSPLETKVMMDGQAWLKTGLKKSVWYSLLCVSPLETKGGDGQAWLKIRLKKSP